MLNLRTTKFFRKKNLGPKSIWDTLYDLYCDFEYKGTTPWWHRSGDEGNANIFFPENKYNLLELKKIKNFLGPKCKDYLRFLEFYNGLTCGQWHFFPTDDPKDQIKLIYKLETAIRHNTASDIEGKMLPMAIDEADHYYSFNIDTTDSANDTLPVTHLYCISTTGAIFSMLFFESLQNKVDLEQKPVPVSNSFKEFMNECVLGPRYLEFGEEDATYRFLQQFIREKDQEQAEFFEKFGKRYDENENPARDPRIMTKLRESRFIIPKKISEQTKDWPEGTRIHFEFDKDDPEQVRCIPIHDKDHQS
jgi:hypothetical protein